MLDSILDEAGKRMDATLSNYKRELGGIRTGRASPELLSSIKVEHYGQQMALEHLSRISVADARTLAIQTWDAEAVEPIMKAIQTSDLGVMPKSEGNTIHVALPPLNEERRQELAKVIRRRAEEARIALRNIRRDQMDAIKGLEKDGECSQDDAKRSQARLQGITDSKMESIDELTAQKEKEVKQV